MADFAFRITDGPYAGKYEIDSGDITANDVGDLLAQRGPDLDEFLVGGAAKGLRAIAGLVWVVRRRGNKGLAYRMVAEHITLDVFAAIDDDEEQPHGELAEKSLDPSVSGSD